MSSMLNPILPYLMSEALGIYKHRSGNIGREVGGFDPLMEMLARYQQTYSNQARPMGGYPTGMKFRYPYEDQSGPSGSGGAARSVNAY